MAPRSSPRTTNEIVEHQIQVWRTEQQRRAQERASYAPPLPIVTISRQAGARGTTIGRRIAEAMGFRFWDQELVHGIAERTGASEALLRAIDEHPRSAVQDLLAGIFTSDRLSSGRYFDQLVVLVRGLVQHGASVVVGRGAHFVVPSESALRVRFVAPIEDRVRFIAAERRLAEDEARIEVDRLDRERAAFMRHHYDRDVTDPAAYDLVINSATLPDDRAVAIVLAAYDAKFPHRLEAARAG